jgi:RNA polymerase sigma-70 factor, ECF subfamily
VEPSDEVLCQRVAERDEAAFDLLVARYQQRAYRLAWSMLRDAEDARDVSQEAFVRLYQTAASFGGRARFSTWFYRIVVNLCLDHYRHQRGWRRILGSARGAGSDDDAAETSALDRLPAPPADPVDALDREQAVTQLWAAVDALSPRQRAVVLLQIRQQLSTSEIAAALECSEATVRVHLHRALQTLRKMVRRD